MAEKKREALWIPYTFASKHMAAFFATVYLKATKDNTFDAQNSFIITRTLWKVKVNFKINMKSI
jgi:hypothetical protein